MTTWVTLLTVIIFVTTLFFDPSAARRPYTAAAYEHARYGNEWDPPRLVVETNLAMYVRAGVIASLNGADIIVYPETGLYFPGNRTQLKSYLEETPDPKKVRANPCNEGAAYSQRPILRTLSCIAKNNSIVVVANFGSIKDCFGEEDCPEDGAFHFNTNVVFDRDGTLLVRYYKEHLFFEWGMDLPKEQQDSTFETDFGTFATYICFDILYGRMGEVAKWPQVDGVMFPVMWFNSVPLYVSVQLFQGWAMGYNATLIAANIQIPGYSSVGSGVFNGLHGSLGYTFNPDGISKLVIAKVPVSGQATSEATIIVINETDSWNFGNDGENVPDICSRALLNDIGDIMKTYRCFEESTVNYTLVKLTKASGYAEACNNGMCCSVSYSTEGMTESFYLGIYNGTIISANRYPWCEESCFIARCDAIGDQLCSTFPLKSNTIFHDVVMQSNFSTEYIYPSVMSSKVRLVPLTEWKYNVEQDTGYKSSISFHSEDGQELTTAGFKARCYDRDPPYRR